MFLEVLILSNALQKAEFKPTHFVFYFSPASMAEELRRRLYDTLNIGFPEGLIIDDILCLSHS